MAVMLSPMSISPSTMWVDTAAQPRLHANPSSSSAVRRSEPCMPGVMLQAAAAASTLGAATEAAAEAEALPPPSAVDGGKPGASGDAK